MDTDKIRKLLNIIFIILAIATIVIYFVSGSSLKLFFIVGMCAIFVKVMEFFIRFINR